eukprot:SAG31_NODE_16414_length_710_cov_0.901800_1_plen_169_part_10
MPVTPAKLAYVRKLAAVGLANGFHFGAVAKMAHDRRELATVLRDAARHCDNTGSGANQPKGSAAALATAAHAAWLRLADGKAAATALIAGVGDQTVGLLSPTAAGALATNGLQELSARLNDRRGPDEAWAYVDALIIADQQRLRQSISKRQHGEDRGSPARGNSTAPVL